MNNPNNPVCYAHAALTTNNAGQDFTCFAAQRNNPVGYAVGGCTAGQMNNLPCPSWTEQFLVNNPRALDRGHL